MINLISGDKVKSAVVENEGIRVKALCEDFLESEKSKPVFEKGLSPKSFVKKVLKDVHPIYIRL